MSRELGQALAGQGPVVVPPPRCYSHDVLHLVAGVAGAAVPRLPLQQVPAHLGGDAQGTGLGQLLTCGAHLGSGGAAQPCPTSAPRSLGTISCSISVTGDVTALTTRNVRAFAQISLSSFQDLLSPLFSFPFLFWDSPAGVSWCFSAPGKELYLHPPCPAVFGLGFPVLLICCLGETRLFHTSCLSSVLSPGRKAPLMTSDTFPLQMSLAAAACWQTPSPAPCPQCLWLIMGTMGTMGTWGPVGTSQARAPHCTLGLPARNERQAVSREPWPCPAPKR